VKVSEFDEGQLLADIRLMEEVGRENDAAARREPPKALERLPPLLQELRREVTITSFQSAMPVLPHKGDGWCW